MLTKLSGGSGLTALFIFSMQLHRTYLLYILTRVLVLNAGFAGQNIVLAFLVFVSLFPLIFDDQWREIRQKCTPHCVD